jgi:ferredoxin-NADP reductase
VVTLHIQDILPATPRARIVRLRVGERDFAYRAGQAVCIGTSGSVRRCPYSIASAPDEAQRDGWIELLVGTDERGHPGAHLDLAIGAPVDVEGPVGSFTLPADEADAQRLVFIAGGTGIAPLRAMLRHALTKPRCEIVLVYSARTPEDFAFAHEFRALASEGRIQLRQTVTRADAPEWQAWRGRLEPVQLAPLVDHPGTVCFVCGPRGFVDDIPRRLEEMGLPRTR